MFMYKLVDGTVDSSLALYTAQAAGLPISTLQRAVQVFDNIKSAQRIRRRDMTEEAYRKEYQRYVSCFFIGPGDEGDCASTPKQGLHSFKHPMHVAVGLTSTSSFQDGVHRGQVPVQTGFRESYVAFQENSKRNRQFQLQWQWRFNQQLI